MVIALYSEGYSFRRISERLGVPKSTASDIVNRFKTTNSVENCHRSGRPPICTPRDERNLIRLVTQNRRASSTQLSHEWKLSNGKQASPSTVRKTLQAHNMQYKAAVKKPRLSNRHVLARRDFCNRVKTWSKYHWRRVKFSDEMNIEVDNRKNRVMIRRRPSEKYHPDCIVQRTKQGSGSLGIWACMDFDGICGFRIFDGRLNQHAYLDILNRELLPTITREQMNGIQSVFQQDNAPCHRAKTVEKWFTDNKITKLTWPANSPDLNCIENLWSWLDSQISKANPQNLDQLKSCVVNHLENVPKSIIENLIDSMPNRINECLKNKGGITRY